MASDNKGTKAALAPKKEAVAKTKSTSGEDVSKVEGSETAAAAPSNYSRGEGQKPVTRAYKENWNAIFGKKTARKTAKNSAKKKKR
jgi:hypothetical protein